MKRALLVVALLVAGCGDDSDTAATTTTTEAAPAVETLEVRVVADRSGLGCSGVSPVGNGDRLEVRADDLTAGVGTFQLSPGAEACDWTASADDLPADADFYRLLGDGTEMMTLSRAEMEERGWRIELRARVDRSIQLEN
jgi:hypothetical protein